MSCITIPDSGLTLGNFPSSASREIPEFLGLTLSNDAIEDMIKCVQNGKPIQLSLGEHPILSYGTKSQHLSAFTDPFTHEIYKTTSDMAAYNKESKQSTNDKLPPMKLTQAARMGKNLLGLVGLKMKPWQEKAKIPVKVVFTGDAAVDALANSIAVENAKKAENTTKLIKERIPIPGKRNAVPLKASNKAKFLNQSRSPMPSSPAMSGVGSPAMGPASMPLSQQQAEHAKAARKPVIHLLAIEPMTEKEIQRKVASASEHDLNQALQKVGDLKDGKWELRRNFYKELDVHTYNYKTSEDRQRAIDNAVKVYDKMRLSASDPEWDRLLVRSERGTGKCLSKLQASIVSKGPKINVENADSGRDTPAKDEDSFNEKNLSKIKGEGAARSSSQEPVDKKKKMSAADAQSKRLFSKNPPKAAVKKAAAKAEPKTKPKTEKTDAKAAPKTAPKPTAAKKTLPAKVTGNAKTLSSEYINESDDDDKSPAATPKPVQKKIQKMNKRPREEEVDTSDSSVPLSKKAKMDADAPALTQRVDTSDSSVPLSKKVRKEIDAPAPIQRAAGAPSQRPSEASTQRTSEVFSHRVSDASSRATTATTSSSFTRKNKSNSPAKSSPLASSPPTNASDPDTHPTNTNSSSSTSPTSPLHHGKSRSPIHKRHQKSSSVTSSSSTGSGSGGRRSLRPEVTDIARKFKMFYPKYHALYKELEGVVRGGGRNRKMEEELADMHGRLEGMKKRVFEGIVSQ